MVDRIPDWPRPGDDGNNDSSDGDGSGATRPRRPQNGWPGAWANESSAAWTGDPTPGWPAPDARRSTGEAREAGDAGTGASGPADGFDATPAELRGPAVDRTAAGWTSERPGYTGWPGARGAGRNTTSDRARAGWPQAPGNAAAVGRAQSAAPVGLRPDDTQPIAVTNPGRQTGGAISWRGVLGVGVVLFAAATISLFVTGNPNLYPTVTLIGSFLVPATFVAFLYQHQHISSLAFEAIARAFVAGGLLGILAASVLEPILLPHFIDQASIASNGGLTFTAGIVVGLVEETCKLLAVVWVARHLRHVGALDGLLVGAAVGMGFAAFESSGYAFTTLLASQGDVLASLVETVTRALFSPFGHGVWTAIVGAVLFQQSDARRFRYTPPVYAALVFVAVLHGAWDGLQSAAAIVLPFQVGISWTMIVVGAIGLVALAVEFRIATRQQADVERTGALPTFE